MFSGIDINRLFALGPALLGIHVHTQLPKGRYLKEYFDLCDGSVYKFIYLAYNFPVLFLPVYVY